MPLILHGRDPAAPEMMESPDCDPVKLRNTYRQFRYINALLSRSRAVYRRWLRPAMTEDGRRYTLLDIGFGGGDIPLKFTQWAARDGHELHVTGIEIDERALEYVDGLSWPETLTFRLASTTELAAAGERYDFVVSNHLLHHLAADAFGSTLAEAAALSRRLSLMVDLQRSDVAWAVFGAATWPFFRDSYIRADGLASLRRSYTHRELAAIAPPGWTVERLFPFRQVLVYDHGGTGG